MKRIKYTRHARNRMRLHKITESDIENSIKFPIITEKSSEGKINVWIKLSDRFLRTTYKELEDKILIITAVKKKKIPKG